MNMEKAFRGGSKLKQNVSLFKSGSAKISTRRGNSQKMTWPQTQPEESPMGPGYKIVGLSTIN